MASGWDRASISVVLASLTDSAGALMIEPTETETPETLDSFCDAMTAIAEEAHRDPEIAHQAPHQTAMRRLDETQAARHPKLRWTKQ